MCRLLGWNGLRVPLSLPLYESAHSLRTQSLASREAPVTRHGDGNGIAWYERGGTPRHVRSGHSIWRDDRMSGVARANASRLGVAHVRAATDGEANLANSHPFVAGRLAFVHVGLIAGMSDIREALLDSLSPGRRAAILGQTDSELLFALLLQHGLERTPAAAYTEAFARIRESQLAAGGEPGIRLAALHADGVSLFAYRYASDGDPPALYRSSAFMPGTTTIASEPLDDRRRGWTRLPVGRLWRVGPRGLLGT